MYGNEMVITPAIAKLMLERNTNNFRKTINKDRVTSYANDMKSGKWQCNGESIVFAKDGTLKDGQHRLYAVIEAGVPVQMFVVFDADNDITIYDSGFNRTVSCVYGKNVTSASAVAKLIICISESNTQFANAKANRIVGVGRITEFIETYESTINKAIEIARNGANHGKGHIAACHAAVFVLLLDGQPEEKIKQFFKIVNSGIPETYIESSAPIAFGKTIETATYSGHTGRVAMLTCALSAYYDFVAGTHRTKRYKADYDLIEYVRTVMKRVKGK